MKVDLKKLSNGFWTWAIQSWRTRMIVGICLILIVIRLVTTCVDMFGIRVGCDEGDNTLIEETLKE